MEDEFLPVAVVTVEGGVDVVPVLELEPGGALVDRRTMRPLDLVAVIVVLGLEPLAA